MIPDPPRQLSWRAIWQAICERPHSLLTGSMLIVTPLVFIGMLSTVFAMAFEVKDNAKILAQGKPTPGEVLRVDIAENISMNGRHPKRVTYRYKLDGVERESSMLTMSAQQIADWKPGKAITVQVLGDESIIIGLPPLEVLSEQEFKFLMPFLVLNGLIGIPFLVYGILGVRRKCALMKNGVVRSARLLSFEAGNSLTSPFPNTRYKARYAYRDSTDKELFGQATTRDMMLLNKEQRGEEIRVLVLPTDERRSTILDGPTEIALSTTLNSL